MKPKKNTQTSILGNEVAPANVFPKRFFDVYDRVFTVGDKVKFITDKDGLLNEVATVFDIESEEDYINIVFLLDTQPYFYIDAFPNKIRYEKIEED